MVTAAFDRKILYEKAQPYLRNPVQKRLYAKEEEWLLKLPVAGREAAYMMNTESDRPKLPVRAIEKRTYLDNADKITSVDPSWDTKTACIELEVWRYDPARFTNDPIVDSFSLALSLKGE